MAAATVAPGTVRAGGMAAEEAEQTSSESAQASAADEGRLLEEIVVVAQKRQQNIQNVGMAIDAFSGAQLRNFGIERSMDVATISPGVHVAGSHAGQQLQFSIRGVVNNDFNPVVETPNAVYLDEAYIAALPGQNFGLFDIDRVEILKGPQGTLFGRNATGGLVHYLSRQPRFDHWEGYASGEFGLYDSPADAYGGRLTAALGGPLGGEGRGARRDLLEPSWRLSQESLSPGCGGWPLRARCGGRSR
ncbi:MAG: TonB-dependent receptor plug domain-containing protein [Rhodothalassiaceae bacterium]